MDKPYDVFDMQGPEHRTSSAFGFREQCPGKEASLGNIPAIGIDHSSQHPLGHCGHSLTKSTLLAVFLAIPQLFVW